jgi:hypothetical protein
MLADMGMEIPETWEPEGQGSEQTQKNDLEEKIKSIPFYMIDLYRLADAGLGSVAEICEKWSMNMVIDALKVLDVKAEIEKQSMQG